MMINFDSLHEGTIDGFTARQGKAQQLERLIGKLQ